MSYNKLIADFIQINNNICESEKIWYNEAFINAYPFVNAFEEITLAMYDLRNEEEILCKSTIEKTTYNSYKEVVEALSKTLVILTELYNNKEYSETFNKLSIDCGVVFKATSKKELGNYVETYINWIEAIKKIK